MRGAVAGVVWTLTGVVVVAVVAVLVFLYSGAYDIAASDAHSGMTRWALGTLFDRSVAAHAPDSVSLPGDEEAMTEGLEHFHAMCETCHGAPGVKRSEIGAGLNPRAPGLADAAEEWTAAELFWVTKHGAKFTGMPAFGRTHSDDEIAAIVAFVRRLPQISEQEYATLVASLPDEDHEHGGSSAGDDPAAATSPSDSASASSPRGHTHPPGTPAHDD